MHQSPNDIRNLLLSIVQSMSSTTSRFVKNPDKDFTRNRKVTFEDVIHLLLAMGGKSLRNEILEYYNCDVTTVTPSAFIQQRKKILPSALEFLLDEFTNSSADSKYYMGYRLLAVDGSDLNVSYDPEDTKTYLQTNESRGFNLYHLNAMYDLINKVYVDALIQPRRQFHEHRALVDMVDRSKITGKVIVIADRGYEAYNVFAHVDQKGWNYLIRVRDRDRQGIVTALDLPDTDEFDIRTHVILTNERTNEFKANTKLYRFIAKEHVFDYLDKEKNRYYPVYMRVVRFRLKKDTYETVITNLPEEEFPPNKLKELYGMRWGIETSFRDLKHTIGLKYFHSKKAEFITQEIYARLIMYNFCAMIIQNIIIHKETTKYAYKVNFSAAVLICRHFLRFQGKGAPPDIEVLLQKNIIPIREGRNALRRRGFKYAFNFLYRVS